MREGMLWTLVTTIGVLAWGIPLNAQTGEAVVVGEWTGTLDAGGTKLAIVFHIEAGPDGSFTGSLDSPDQGAFGIPVSGVRVDGDEITFEVAAARAEYRGTVAGDGESLSGVWSQGGATLPLDLRKDGDGRSERPPRPQEPSEPLPYDVEEVTIRHEAAGIELAGTLTTPRGPGPFPAAVLVSGSGPQDRDESIAGHKPFLVLADHLTRAGIAVLRYDDRGAGRSTGVHATATTEDFAADALAAVAFAVAQPRVAGDRVGIVGHSEGGLVGPMAAARSDDVAFVVMLAGPGVTGLEILLEQGRLIARAGGSDPAVVEMNARVQTGLAEIAAAEPDPEAAEPRMRSFLHDEIAGIPEGVREAVEAQFTSELLDQTIETVNGPWFRFFMHHDPRPDLRRLDVPVLALFGEKDLQVPPAQSAGEVERALTASSSPDWSVRTLDGLNHLFQEAETGNPAEYARLEQTMSPEALSTVSDWIGSRFAR